MIKFESENQWLFVMFKNGYLDILDFSKNGINKLKNPITNNIEVIDKHFGICQDKMDF